MPLNHPPPSPSKGCMFYLYHWPNSQIRSSSDSLERSLTPWPLHKCCRRTDHSARTALPNRSLLLASSVAQLKDGSQGGAPLSHITPPRAMRLQPAAMQRSVRLLQAPHWKTSRDTVHALVRVCVTTCRHQLHSPCTSVSPCAATNVNQGHTQAIKQQEHVERTGTNVALARFATCSAK